MAKQCGYCVYMRISDLREGKYYCEKNHNYQFADSFDAENCYKYCARWAKDMYLGDDAVKISKAWKKSNDKQGCFITTIVVNILGFDDNCEALTVLRKFRNNVLQKNEKYRELLMKYDIIGPKIAAHLSEDENREIVAADLYFDYIIPCVDALKLGDETTALIKYTDMTNLLTSRYLVQDSLNVNSEEYNNYNMSKGGHGRLVLY